MRDSLQSRIVFGTKAETLEQLCELPLASKIPHFFVVNHAEWCENQELTIANIAADFGESPLAIRSSARCEDGVGHSNAGAFQSFLGQSAADHDSLQMRINDVFATYPDTDPNNQVLVQEMVRDIQVGGVIFTRCLDDGAPYYVLNYDDESGSPDSVTGGRGVHTTVMVYRGYKPEYCDSMRVRQMLALAQELESYAPDVPLDIEFAMDQSCTMHLLQVRRISTVGKWHPDNEHRIRRLIPHIELFVEKLSVPRAGIYGNSTILGNMPDWNPAEIIGVVPLPLATSLYRRLITSRAWSQARMAMGYRILPQTELMVLISGRPYIDVRASFNSFLPEGIPDTTGEHLVNAWLQRLADIPSLHDKIEFEVATTILDFTFDETMLSRYASVLSKQECREYRAQLARLTCTALGLSERGSLACSLKKVEWLHSRQYEQVWGRQVDEPVAIVSKIGALLDEGVQSGTVPFAVIARHAFIAESLLRSACQRGAISAERVDEFKASFQTIMGELAHDMMRVVSGQLTEADFHARYGHLRPGTYDILSSCYRNRAGLFEHCHVLDRDFLPRSFNLSPSEESAINALLKESGLDSIDAQRLIVYARRAIQGREYAKFVFTRNLSDVLELIAKWGSCYGLGREDLAHLVIEDILDTIYSSLRGEMTSMLMSKVDQARMETAYAGNLRLSHLIRGVKDVHVVPIHRAEPNFITGKRIECAGTFLQPSSRDHGGLEHRIVCIENADPGFDWIFAKGIAGLITKYGGANSHMAIRCAELQLPAAIGCGEDLFERVKGWRKIAMDCRERSLRPVAAHV